MTRSTISRVITLLALAVLMMAAAPVFAQEPLPLPAVPTTDAPREGTETANTPSFVFLVAQPVWPMNNMLLYVGTPFKWTNVSATSYAIKIKVVETGESFTVNPAYTCDPTNCTADPLASGVFNHLSDGQHIKWQVITKVGGMKFKSTTFSASVDEVDLRELISPADGASMPMNDFTSLTWWQGGSVNLGFQVIVKEKLTGKTVISRPIAVGAGSCTYDKCTLPITMNEKIMVLKTGTSYSWWVTFFGRSGEQLKTPKRTFSIQ